MARIAILLLLSLLWAASGSGAVYQCRDQEGNLFLTDDRDNFPPGCEPMGEPIVEETEPPAEEAPTEAREASPDVPGGPPSASAPSSPGERQAASALEPEGGAAQPPPERGSGPATPQAEIPPLRAGEEGPGTSPEDVRQRLSGDLPPVGQDTWDDTADQVPDDDTMDFMGEPESPMPPGGEPGFEGGEIPTGGESPAIRNPQIDRWRNQAAELARQYDVLRDAASPQTDLETRIQRLEDRIEIFLDRLAASPLTPEEQAEVEAALPPPQ